MENFTRLEKVRLNAQPIHGWYEPYGDIKTSGNNIWGRNVWGSNIRGRIIPVPEKRQTLEYTTLYRLVMRYVQLKELTYYYFCRVLTEQI
jgi:hypothetical protein